MKYYKVYLKLEKINKNPIILKNKKLLSYKDSIKWITENINKYIDIDNYFKNEIIMYKEEIKTFINKYSSLFNNELYFKLDPEDKDNNEYLLYWSNNNLTLKKNYDPLLFLDFINIGLYQLASPYSSYYYNWRITKNNILIKRGCFPD